MTAAAETPPSLDAQIMGFANASMINAKAKAEALANAKVPTVARCSNCTESERKLKVALDERDKARDICDELDLRAGVFQVSAASGHSVPDSDDTIRRLQSADVAQRDNIWTLEQMQELLLSELRKHGIPIPQLPRTLAQEEP